MGTLDCVAVRKLTPRTLDWIDEAPVKIPARGSSSASPDAVFAVLADHETWPEWFPAVNKVEVIGGQAAGVGARRRVHVPGAWFEEEFIAWEPGTRWTFIGTATNRGLTRSLLEDCRLEPTADGGTAMTYTMYLDPPPLLGPLVKLAARRIKANNTKAMAALGERAARA